MLPSLAAAQDWIDDLVKPKGPRKSESDKVKPDARKPDKSKTPEKRPSAPRSGRRPVSVLPRLGRHATLPARTWNLCAFERDLDMQSQGAIVASDGNVYFFSSTRSVRHGAVAFRYLTAEDRLERLCDDVTTVCGERPGTGWSQGVVSTQPVGINGWIYWGTHSSAANAPTYTGGHVVGWNIGTGEWRDLGVVLEGHTIYAGLAGDPRANRLYVTASPTSGRQCEPTRLVALDLEQGKREDLGVVAYGGMIGYPSLWVDQDGHCWVSAPGGVMIRYNSRKKVLEGWLDGLPYLRTLEGFTHIDGSLQARRRWWWVSGLRERNRCLLTLKDGTTLYMFSPRRIGLGPGKAFQIVTRNVGRPGLACAVSEGRVYYIHREESRDGPNGYVLQLRSVDYTRPLRKSHNHGVLMDEKGRLPQRIAALLVEAGRRAYVVGDWTTVQPDPTSLSYDGKGRYVERKTAQFFAAVQIPQD